MSHLSISVGRLEADRGRGLPIRCEHRHLRGGRLHRRQEHLPAPWPWPPPWRGWLWRGPKGEAPVAGRVWERWISEILAGIF